MGRVTSDVTRGIIVTQYIGVGHIARGCSNFQKNIPARGNGILEMHFPNYAAPGVSGEPGGLRRSAKFSVCCHILRNFPRRSGRRDNVIFLRF